MLKHVYQSHTDVNDHTKGDCFAACVATILGISLAEARQGLNDHPNPRGDWWGKFQEWLEGYGLHAVEVKLLPSVLAVLLPGVPVILSGKSPRGDWQHSVVGVVAVGRAGFEYVHDPYPDGKFFEEEPAHVLFFAALRPDMMSRQWREGRRKVAESLKEMEKWRLTPEEMAELES